MIALCCMLMAAQDAAPRALSPKELDALVARAFAADGRTQEGFEERERVAAELASCAALDAKAEKTWRDKLAKLAAKTGPELEKGTGAHFFWPADKRSPDKGLYIVGGNVKRPKGLMIGLHGGGAGSGDAWSAHGALDSVASKHDLLGIFPEVLVKTERGWTDSGTEEFVLQLIEAAARTWKLDLDRVYFSGHSMGGYGSWLLGAHHADMVAAIAPSAGAPTPVVDSSGVANDIDWGIVPNLRNVRVRIYQSDDDRNVPPAANRIAAKKLGEARERWGGFDFEYWEVPSRQHELPPGGMDALFSKVVDCERDPRPSKIVWQPTLPWKRQFYWLHWKTPKKYAIVEAELDKSANTVRVTCDGDASGLSVLLDDELVDLDREVIVMLGGSEVYRGLPQRSLATLVRTAVRNDPQLVFSAEIPLVR